MENKLPWVLVNSENVKSFVCDDTYSSKMLTGDEMAGFGVININEGTLKPGCSTAGGAHDDAEIYYVLDCEPGAVVWVDDDAIPAKKNDIIVIPPHVFHWIDNTKCKRPFVLLTFWPRQELNGVFFARQEAWGTSVANLDEDYLAKRNQDQ